MRAAIATQIMTTVGKTQSKCWFQASGGTGAGSLVVPLLCRTYFSKLAILLGCTLQKFNCGGGSNIDGESCQLHFQSAHKTKKFSAQSSLKFRAVSNNFWEGTKSEKSRLKKVTSSVR